MVGYEARPGGLKKQQYQNNQQKQANWDIDHKTPLTSLLHTVFPSILKFFGTRLWQAASPAVSFVSGSVDMSGGQR